MRQQLKTRTLAALEAGQVLSAAELAVGLGRYRSADSRSMSGYLGRLYGFGLVQRERWGRKFLYRISERGRSRLEWLRNQG